MGKSHVLLLTLRVFSATGGIEKVCRILGKALFTLSGTGNSMQALVFSMYDRQQDVNAKYFPASMFRGFGMRKLHFVLQSVRQGMQSDVVILSHINLLLVGVLIKLFSPRTKLVLITHGIEVWAQFPAYKKWMLGKCDRILPVSDYTRKTMMDLNRLPAGTFTVMNNCLDPFMESMSEGGKDSALLKRYGFTKNHTILLTLTRLSARERYKGYDQVIRAMVPLVQEFPDLRYLVVGKYDDEEKQRLDTLIRSLSLEDKIVFAGFVPDDELEAHYNLADIYVMPSKKEGFGLVFIEAMYFGKRVIAGNKDGSVDALLNGTLGVLVDPDEINGISAAIKQLLLDPNAMRPDHDLLMKHFSFETYLGNLRNLLAAL